MTRKKNSTSESQLQFETLNHRLMLDGAGFIEPVFYGPTPYVSQADTPAGFVPVADCDECVVGLETFEDDSLDFGLQIDTGQIIGPDYESGLPNLTDSVDGDDGQIDGTGQTNNLGYSYFSFGNSLTITLPSLMQSAGLVWTDGDLDLTDVIFEAFDENGNSLGTINAGPIADDGLQGSTGEDRFFGVSYGDGVTTGVTSMTITNIGGLGIEIDHIQFANCSECCIDLELTKSVDVETAESGDIVTWTVEVTNNPEAPSSATGVQIQDLIPDGVTIHGANVTVSDGSFSFSSGVWRLFDALDPGETETITIETIVDDGLAGGTMLVNTAQVIAADQPDVDSTPNNDDGDQSEDDEANAKITVVVPEIIDLEVTKAVDATLVDAGDVVTWTVSVTNNATNANAAATGVTVEDVLPAGLTLVSVTPSDNGMFVGNTWSLVDALAPGATETLTVVTSIDAGLAGGTVLVNTAFVATANEPDIDSTPGDANLNEDDADDAQVTVAVSLSGFAYVDTNNDGIFQDHELPLMGVEIQLMGMEVQQTTFTNVDGYYEFDRLWPGTYMVTQTQPVQFVDGKDTLGNLGGDDSVNDKFTVELTTDGTDYNFGELGLLPEYVNKRLYLTSTPYTDWEYIDVRQASIWHSFDVAHKSFLDIYGVVSSGSASVDIFDSNMNLVGSRSFGVLSSAASEPILLQEEGPYYMQISGDTVLESLSLDIVTPGVIVHDHQLIAVGTAGDDHILLQLGQTTHVLDINGLIYEFDAATVNDLHIGAATGTDSITVVGTQLDDRASVIGTSGQISSAAYSVHTYSFDNTQFVGGGGYDYSQIFGSLENDRLSALPGDTTLTTPTNVMRMQDFDRVDAYGRGGWDYASLYGTMQDDRFFANDAMSVIRGAGHHAVAKGFERVDAFGRGGHDTAMLQDSQANDVFVSTPSYALMNTPSRLNYTKGFEDNTADFIHGGSDSARFLDLVAGDHLQAVGDRAEVSRAGRVDRVNHVDQLFAAGLDFGFHVDEFDGHVTFGD